MPLSLAHIKLAILLSHFIICALLLNMMKVFLTITYKKSSTSQYYDLCRFFTYITLLSFRHR